MTSFDVIWRQNQQKIEQAQDYLNRLSRYALTRWKTRGAPPCYSNLTLNQELDTKAY